MSRFVVTGTDTEIGKTVFASGLAGMLQVPYWKPVQAGLEACTDSEFVAKMSGVPILPEAYRLKLAASPHQAAAQEGIAIDPGKLEPAPGALIIEGAGGLMVPLTREILFVDVFARWKIPLILCARTSLGTINHSLLSLEAIRTRDIPLHGIAFIGEENQESENIILEKSRARRLGRLGHIDPLTPLRLRDSFAKAFRREDFV